MTARHPTPLATALLLALLWPAATAAQTPLDDSFTYQGYLEQAGTPVNGLADIRFSLWDDASDGNQIASTLLGSEILVANGVFTAELDFGPAFDGNARWLEIAVRAPAGSGSFTTLAPRQSLTATPYALQTRGLYVDGAGRVGVNTTFNRAQFNVTSGSPSFAGQIAVVNDTCSSNASACPVFIAGWSQEYFDNNQAEGRLWGLGNDLSGDRDVHFFNQLDAGLGLGTGGRRKDLFIDELGQVGIGTTAPTATLDIAGTLAVEEILFADGTRATTGRQALESPIAHVRLTNGIELGTLETALDQDNPPLGQQFITAGDTQWQSFTAGATGELAAVEVYRQIDAAPVTMSLYAGEGMGGELLASSTIGGAPVRQWQSAAAFDPPVPIVSGNTYTIALSGSSIRWIFAMTNTYAGGRASTNVAHDFFFRTYIISPLAESFPRTRLTIDAPTGHVGIGRTPTANALEVQGDASKSTAGSWLANSDARIKTAVETISGALDTINHLRLVSFEYTDGYRASHPGAAARRYYNVIAQEFAAQFPDYVQGSGEHLEDGAEILQVDTYPLTIYAAAAIQELHTLVQARDQELAALRRGHQAELAELRAANEALADRLTRLEQRLTAHPE